MDIKKNIEKWHPNIVGKPYKILKVLEPNEDTFNCISFTLDIYTDWMWTNESIWPNEISRNLGITGFKMLYEKYGYKICDTDDFEDGYEKIALYSKDNRPTHAAKQYNNL